MNYSVQELIHNQSFRRMARAEASAREIARWNDWIEADESHRRKARKASAEIVGFSIRQTPPTNMDRKWKRLEKVTVGRNEMKSPNNFRRRDQWGWIYHVAAILMVASLVGWGIYMFTYNSRVASKDASITRQRTLRTGPREQQTLRFSSGSKIVLAENSTMTYELSAPADGPLRVDLDGKAYFDTGEQSAEGRRFLVHTSGGTINDIGTKFFVKTQGGRSQVGVQQGKVIIRSSDITAKAPATTVKRGEILSFSSTKIFDKRETNPTFYTSWATGVIRFDHDSIGEIAEFIRRRFDVRVQLANSSIAGITLQGTVRFKALPGLLRSISISAGVKIYPSQHREVIYIGNKRPGNIQK